MECSGSTPLFANPGSAERFQREIEKDARLIVGVNAFTEGNEDSDLETLRISPEVERKQRARLDALRQRRDSDQVEAALARLESAARADENLMDPMLEAVRAYATLGETRNALERVYGRFREPVFF